MKCDICGCTENYIKDYNHTFNIKGKKITFISKRRFCKSCNNLVYDSILDNEASIKAINLYNSKYGISIEDIISLRKKYNLSIETFAKIIGCAKKTLISYEQGKSIPNDTYLLVIKSLIEKPNIIYTLLNVNKLSFTEKEYNKILANVNEYIENNSNNKLTNYNGYKKLEIEKVNNIIIYLSKEEINKTKLLKEMFYIDFLYFKNNCVSITGLEYAKLPYGPVPDNFDSIINNCINNNLINYKIESKGEYQYHKIKSLKEFNKSIFSKEELNTLKSIKEKFKDYTSSEITEYSHKEKLFIENKLGDKISYDYAFDINID